MRESEVVTGMTEAERWHLVAWKVADGMAFSRAVGNVLGKSFPETRGTDWDSLSDEDFSSDEYYIDCGVIYALLLAEDAADEEANVNIGTVGVLTDSTIGTATVGFTPVHITYCAEDQPMPAVFVGPEPEQDEPEVSLGNYPATDRRRTWGEKVAQGLRKWADWAEARF